MRSEAPQSKRNMRRPLAWLGMASLSLSAWACAPTGVEETGVRRAPPRSGGQAGSGDSADGEAGKGGTDSASTGDAADDVQTGGTNTVDTPGTAGASSDSGSTPVQTGGSDGEPTTEPAKPVARQLKTTCLESPATLSPKSAMPAAYLETCAGCHGADGLGVGEFPTLKGISLSQMDDIVRNGKGTQMPSFAMTEIGPLDLHQVVVNLSGQDAESRNDDLCSVNDVREETFDWTADYNAGLQFWRKPDADGAACTNCHAPDGFDLAATGATSADIFRRGLLHLPVEDVELVDKFLAAVRAKFNLPVADTPKEIIPFQPGGQPLDCGDPKDFPEANRDKTEAIYKSDYWSECDHMFGKELAKLSPTLAGAPITTIADAKQAAEEMMRENFRTFRVGFKLNALGQDGYHGKEHNTVADWFPDFHRPVKSDADREILYAAMDDYLANPTWDELWKMVDAVEKLTKPVSQAGQPLNQVISNKYLSILVYQHILREEMVNGNAFVDMPETIADKRNYFWRAGDAARAQSDRDNYRDNPIDDKLKKKFNEKKRAYTLGMKNVPCGTSCKTSACLGSLPACSLMRGFTRPKAAPPSPPNTSRRR